MKKSIKKLIFVLLVVSTVSLNGDNWTYSDDASITSETEGCINCGKSYGNSQNRQKKPLITSQDPFDNDKKHIPQGFGLSPADPIFFMPT